MENNEISTLIEVFKQYRDLITPIEQSLKDFSYSFESMKTDIESLNNAFDGNVQNKLDKIYKELSAQADKSKNLSTEIDRFMSFSNKYVVEMDKLVEIGKKLESNVISLNGVQGRAEAQLDKLDKLIEEKKKTYDVKQLEKNLEQYNSNVQKITDYINKDVAAALRNNNENIKIIQDKNDSVLENLISEKESINSLVENYKQNNILLKKVVEHNDLNEEYIFSIIDEWAESRKVKTKK